MIILKEHVYYFTLLIISFILPIYILPQTMTLKLTETEDIIIHSPYTYQSKQLNLFGFLINFRENYLLLVITFTFLYQTFFYLIFHSKFHKNNSSFLISLFINTFNQLKWTLYGSLLSFIILIGFGAPMWIEREGFFETIHLSILLSLYCLNPFFPFVEKEISLFRKFQSILLIYFQFDVNPILVFIYFFF